MRAGIAPDNQQCTGPGHKLFCDNAHQRTALYVAQTCGVIEEGGFDGVKRGIAVFETCGIADPLRVLYWLPD